MGETIIIETDDIEHLRMKSTLLGIDVTFTSDKYMGTLTHMRIPYMELGEFEYLVYYVSFRADN